MNREYFAAGFLTRRIRLSCLFCEQPDRQGDDIRRAKSPFKTLAGRKFGGLRPALFEGCSAGIPIIAAGNFVTVIIPPSLPLLSSLFWQACPSCPQWKRRRRPATRVL